MVKHITMRGKIQCENNIIDLPYENVTSFHACFLLYSCCIYPTGNIEPFDLLTPETLH